MLANPTVIHQQEFTNLQNSSVVNRDSIIPVLFYFLQGKEGAGLGIPSLIRVHPGALFFGYGSLQFVGGKLEAGSQIAWL
jgi:hypothetical protein